MSREAWPALVAHYAKGRPVCNCGCAYYTPCGVGYKGGQYREDLLACKHGCSANQIGCREEIAKRVLADMQVNGSSA